ncbi:DUF5131 family protein [Streptomyces sp. WAC08241]|uniref:DUF5131 family protein n=1 Tax=Streptomyces sp. WAC08241 TaxID=2487421 RepID=UPI000F7827FA|nr:phage Gp37/Gp68 family protein [Streptomyces sp. WAC08241]RSS33778.1 phage Gp37/Gp68 family protein [Streptomyces sp. WAC08241]
MADKTDIEWTDRTWNAVTGCTQISAGCDNCYARTIAERFRGGAAFPHGFDIQVRPDKVNAPLTWRKPAKVFVNSMSDLFHAGIDRAWIADIFAVMAAAPRHTFQVLTKRHARMRSLLADPAFVDQVRSRAIGKGLTPEAWTWPLPNVWLGVSVENQQWADIRIPALLDTPATIRWISAEPLLGPIDITDYTWKPCPCCNGEGHDEACGPCADTHCDSGRIKALRWVVAGGESGHGARPAHPDWFRTLRDQCAQERIPYLFKQWGAYIPTDYLVIGGPRTKSNIAVGDPVDDLGHRVEMKRVSKKAAGRELDGRIHDDYPATP